MQQVACFIKSNNLNSSSLLYNNPYLSLLLEKDHFDPEIHLNLNEKNIRRIKQGNVIIWDSWFSGYENNVSLKDVEEKKSLKKINEFSIKDNDRKIRALIYRKPFK